MILIDLELFYNIYSAIVQHYQTKISCVLLISLFDIFVKENQKVLQGFYLFYQP